MGKKTQYRDEEHKPFAVLLASKPPADRGRTSSTILSAVIHGVLLTGGILSLIHI